MTRQRQGSGGRLEAIAFVVEEAEAGQRLDRVLAARVEGVSRSQLQRWIEQGRVWVDGVLASRRVRPRAGQQVLLQPAPPPAAQAEPQPIDVPVLYEDEHLWVVDKPAGLVVHPAPGHPDGTLVNALLHRDRELLRHFEQGGGERFDPLRPGIVHRLDKDTSGLLVVARTPEAHRRLVASFQAHRIERRYLAVAVGEPPERARWDTPFGRHPRDRKRFSSRLRQGKRAVTELRVLQRLDGAALLLCTLQTGRTHQIRVHLAEHGYPVLGDPLYGRPPRSARLRELARLLDRQALHAAVLGFEHPVRGEPMRFVSPLPADLQAVVRALGGEPERAHEALRGLPPEAGEGGSAQHGREDAQRELQDDPEDL